MSPSVAALYTYPVKGLSAQPLQSASIVAGGTMPFDRAYAIENGPSGFDPAAPAWRPKIAFLMLMRNEALAGYRFAFDVSTAELAVRRDGEPIVSGCLSSSKGRANLERWIAEAFGGDLRGAPKIVAAPGHSFSDRSGKVLHLVNLASVRDLEKRLGRPVDPLRFRPNIMIDGAEAFAELDWIGRRIDLPNIALKGESRTERCAATNVDPQTGLRDMKLPRDLVGHYGHADFGIYVIAATDGSIGKGDRILIAPPRGPRKQSLN